MRLWGRRSWRGVDGGPNGAALPPPLAEEGWGEGVSSGRGPLEERALTRSLTLRYLRARTNGSEGAPPLTRPARRPRRHRCRAAPRAG
ncbi:hypothetical protein EHH60_20375 [Bradyrhizobium sp. RP6]|nr:hypothetical protein EHH60_20375 [Bradyrhizobium sp. RP6]